TRALSVSASTSAAPGRVDSPPTSRMSAPSAASASPWATAASAEAKSPPSEKLSGVTLTTPMTSVRPVRRRWSGWGMKDLKQSRADADLVRDRGEPLVGCDQAGIFSLAEREIEAVIDRMAGAQG